MAAWQTSLVIGQGVKDAPQCTETLRKMAFFFAVQGDVQNISILQ
jgi:hypothetical protein